MTRRHNQIQTAEPRPERAWVVEFEPEPGRPAAPAGPRLAESLDRLGTLVLAEETVESVLALAVRLAADTVPGAHGASASLLPGAGSMTDVVATEEVSAFDEVQYECHRGPAIQVAHDGRCLNLELNRMRTEWPELTEAAEAAGFRSVLAAPMVAEGRTIGVLMLYSRTEGAFGRDEIATAAQLARHAAANVLNVATITAADRIRHHLEESLLTRDVIGQAQGILMARHLLTARQAFDELRRTSQLSNRKLREVAAEVVAEHEGEALHLR